MLPVRFRIKSSFLVLLKFDENIRYLIFLNIVTKTMGKLLFVYVYPHKENVKMELFNIFRFV